MGRVLGETIAVTMACGFALGAAGGTRLLTVASVIVIPGLAIIAYHRRNAG